MSELKEVLFEMLQEKLEDFDYFYSDTAEWSHISKPDFKLLSHQIQTLKFLICRANLFQDYNNWKLKHQR